MIDGWSATADGNLESWKIGAKILKHVQDDRIREILKHPKSASKMHFVNQVVQEDSEDPETSSG